MAFSQQNRTFCVIFYILLLHVNAWGLPYGAALAGADLLLPDRFLAAEPLAGLIAAERPTLMGCVPTIFADLLRYVEANPGVDLSSLTNATSGGSAVPRQLMKDFEERHGVEIFQAWGMTETSPVATFSRPLEGEHDDAYWDARAKQGRPLPWVELRLIGDDGAEVAWDGESTGEIEVRGPWIAARYQPNVSGTNELERAIRLRWLLEYPDLNCQQRGPQWHEAGKSITDMGWQTKTWTFVATGQTTTLEFYSLMSPTSWFGPAIDIVSVVAVH